MRVLLAWELGHGYGHLARLTSLAWAFKRRGCHVDFVCRSHDAAPAALEGPFSQIIVAPVVLGLGHVPSASSSAQLIRAGGFGVASTLQTLIGSWLSTFALLRPDILICDYAPAALLAAHVAGLRAARVGTGFFVPPRNELPHLRPWKPISAQHKRLADSDADRSIAHVCQAYGVAPLDGYLGLVRTASPYWTTWPQTDHLGAREGVRYYGPLETLGGGASLSWPSATGPKVLAYLPPDSADGRRLHQVLAQLGWPTLWHGRKAEPACRTITICEQPLNLPHHLQQADIFIGRAGHGATCQALLAGCPQIMIPDQLEASLLAYRAGRQGYAIPLRPSSDTATLIATLISVAWSSDIRQRIRTISNKIGPYDGAAAADYLAKDIMNA